MPKMANASILFSSLGKLFSDMVLSVQISVKQMNSSIIVKLAAKEKHRSDKFPIVAGLAALIDRFCHYINCFAASLINIVWHTKIDFLLP